MKVYLMTDLEGVAGVLDSENWCLPTSRYYEQAKELLTREVNAAVDGFVAAGATEVLVADGHGPGAIQPDRLHRAAELSRGWPTGAPYPFAMDSRRFDVAAWVGQHPKAGAVGGHICHTGSMDVRDLSINGVSVGEFGEMALCAAELGVRVVFASGCEAFTREAGDLIPGIETVAVKRGLQTAPGHNLPPKAYRAFNVSAIHLSPEESRRRIRAGAQRAIERARTESFGLLTRIHPPYEARLVTRSDELNPPRLARKRHLTSAAALLNAPWTYETLAADPLRLVEGQAQ